MPSGVVLGVAGLSFTSEYMSKGLSTQKEMLVDIIMKNSVAMILFTNNLTV